MEKLKCILTQERVRSIFEDIDALSVFSRKIGYICLFDRFGYLNQFTNWNVSNFTREFPSSSYTGSFSEIMMGRGKEVLNLAKSAGKNLYVLWSGGVDSTAVVLSLLENASIDERNHIKILYTNSSVDEFPNFHDYLLAIKNLERIRLNMLDFSRKLGEITKTDYIVTGFPADQLFGSIINQTLPFAHNEDWKTFIKSKTAIEQFESAFSHYGLPVKTVSELTWFMNFTGKWDIVNHILSSAYGLPHRNTINFFDTLEFQEWSVSNFDRLHKLSQKDTRYYKVELKTFINSLFRDEDYTANKGKVGSIGYGWVYDKARPEYSWIALLDENDEVLLESFDEPHTAIVSPRVQSIMNRKLIKYRKQSM